MKQTIDVIFDGEVLRLQQPLDLIPNTSYRVTIEDLAAPPISEQGGPFDRILALAQDLGIPDLAEQHDHYLYGTPKR